MEGKITHDEEHSGKTQYPIALLVEMTDEDDEGKRMSFNFRYRLEIRDTDIRKRVDGLTEFVGADCDGSLDDAVIAEHGRDAERASIVLLEKYIRENFHGDKRMEMRVRSTYGTEWYAKIE